MDLNHIKKNFINIIWKDIEEDLMINTPEWKKRFYTYYDPENRTAYDISTGYMIYSNSNDEKWLVKSFDRLESFLKFDKEFKNNKYSKVDRVIRVFWFENTELFNLVKKYWVEFFVIKK